MKPMLLALALLPFSGQAQSVQEPLPVWLAHAAAAADDGDTNARSGPPERAPQSTRITRGFKLIVKTGVDDVLAEVATFISAARPAPLAAFGLVNMSCDNASDSGS